VSYVDSYISSHTGEAQWNEEKEKERGREEKRGQQWIGTHTKEIDDMHKGSLTKWSPRNQITFH